MNLISLQFKTTLHYQTNLDRLVSLINKCDDNSFILAPEVCLTGFDYENFNHASLFSHKAIEVLRQISNNKTILITMIIDEDDRFYNRLFIFDKNNIIYTQDKSKLFALGNEDKYFIAGDTNNIKIIEVLGIKIAILICFELRFIDLWQQIKGANIIFVPAMWGLKRKEHYISLTKSLAIINQCYVVCSDSSNCDMASSSGIINPNGDEYRDDTQEMITLKYETKLIKTIQKYIKI